MTFLWWKWQEIVLIIKYILKTFFCLGNIYRFMMDFMLHQQLKIFLLSLIFNFFNDNSVARMMIAFPSKVHYSTFCWWIFILNLIFLCSQERDILNLLCNLLRCCERFMFLSFLYIKIHEKFSLFPDDALNTGWLKNDLYFTYEKFQTSCENKTNDDESTFY